MRNADLNPHRARLRTVRPVAVHEAGQEAQQRRSIERKHPRAQGVADGAQALGRLAPEADAILDLTFNGSTAQGAFRLTLPNVRKRHAEGFLDGFFDRCVDVGLLRCRLLDEGDRPFGGFQVDVAVGEDGAGDVG